MAQMWIDNRWTGASDGRVFDVHNPATEEVLDQAPRAAAADVDKAVAAAKRAFPDWRRTPGIEKCEKLHHAAARIREDREALAILLTKEGGKPLPENRDEIEWIAACFDYYAEIGRDVVGRVISPVARNQFNFVVKEPFGVAGLIVPWNYPLLLLSWKLAPALAAGNTVVAKPSEWTPLTTLRLMRAFEDLPEGVLNVITGFGDEAGAPLVAHRDVEIVAFTGSQATGRKVAITCAEQLKKCHLELGGNDPLIVDEGVDLDVAAKGAAWAGFLNMGQVCTSVERVFVVGKSFDEFVDRFVAYTKSLRIGDPLGPDVDLGPMINATQREKVEGKVAEARAAGARVLTGGKRPERFAKGYFYEPTVVVDVKPELRLLREETFGPVAPLVRCRDIDEAIALADRSEFGLGASIYTNNLEHAMKAAETIHAGTFWINDPLTDNDAGPFGGMRRSGLGRELGSEGLEDFRDSKHVHMDYVIGAKPYWYPYRFDRPKE
ncbi:MAG TPA: aldehyde dehydrogenase family protein [Vicinamibacteria bacterium]|nr:aldehyde dehydrogenase family protein [Vicinamibacteria bacterium]